MAEKIDALITPINDILYYPVLIIGNRYLFHTKNRIFTRKIV